MAELDPCTKMILYDAWMLIPLVVIAVLLSSAYSYAAGHRAGLRWYRKHIHKTSNSETTP